MRRLYFILFWMLGIQSFCQIQDKKIIIDGCLEDWDTLYTILESEDIQYNLINDRDNLYLGLSIHNAKLINDVLITGLKVIINEIHINGQENFIKYPMGTICQKYYNGGKYQYSENELNLSLDELYSTTEISGFNLGIPATRPKKDSYGFMDFNLKIVSLNNLSYEFRISLNALYGNNVYYPPMDTLIIEFQTGSWIYYEIENMYILSSLELIRPLPLFRKAPINTTPSVSFEVKHLLTDVKLKEKN